MAQRMQKWLARGSILLLLSTLIYPLGIQIKIPVTYAATYIITNTNDSGAGSLRQAITDANSNAGADLIMCDSGLSGTISLNTALPQVTESLNFDCSGSASAVTMSGSLTTGLDLAGTSTSYTIKGIRLAGFGTKGITIGTDVSSATIGGTGLSAEAVYVNGANSTAIEVNGDNVTIQNVVIGDSAAPTTGIDINSTASNINIGNSGTNGSVTITGSAGGTGIPVSGSSVTIVATTVSSFSNGIAAESGSSNVTIGGSSAGTRNIIKGNGGYGIIISGTTVTVSGNYIGLASDGSTVSANGNGIWVESTASGVTIGGDSASYGNVISGNSGVGAMAIDMEAANTTIKYNYIGTNAAGTAAKANNTGINIENNGVTVSYNLISGNSSTGIRISEQNRTITSGTISNNVIGLNATETAAIANGESGIYFSDASATYTLSGITIQNNVIAGNTAKGIDGATTYTGSNSHNIWGNKIGTNSTGTTDYGNGTVGISINGNSWNLDASSDSSKRNVIIGNDGGCMNVNGDSNIIKGNYCGIGADGTTEVPNGTSVGISVQGGGENNVIGGIATGAENLICTSDSFNVNLMFDAGAGNGNTFRGNDVKCNVELPLVALGGLVPPMITKYGSGTANDSLTAPTISSATTTAVSGTGACASCTVDLYGTSATDGGMYITSATADGSGNFSFSGLSLGSYSKVIAAYTNGSGSTSPSTVGYTITANSAPTVSSVAAVESTNGTGNVTITATTIDDADDNNVQLKFEYSNDGGTSWGDPTLSSASTGTLNNASTYQVSGISTSSGAVSTFTIMWAAATDLSSTTDISNARIRVTPYDGTEAGSAASSSNFELDLADPTTPTLSYTSSITAASAVISISGTEASSSIYLNDVDTGSDTDGSGAFSLTVDTPVVGTNIKIIKIVDAYGNISSTSTATFTRTSSAVQTGGSYTTTTETAPSTDTTEESMAGEEEPSAPAETETTPTETQQEEPSAPAETETTPTETQQEEPSAPAETDETATEEAPVVAPAIGTETVTELSDTQAQGTFESATPTEVSPREAYEDQTPERVSLFTTSESNGGSSSLGTILEKSELFGETTEEGIPEILIEVSGQDPSTFNAKGDDDRDGLTNAEELAYHCEMDQKDSDNDGLTDIAEVFGGSDCGSYDTDMDGIADAEDEDPVNPNRMEVSIQKETAFEQALTQALQNEGKSTEDISIKTNDFDADGVSDWEELRIGSDPMNTDSDQDGINDGAELLNYGTSPTTANKAEDLQGLRITNLGENSFVPEGAQIFSGRGTPSSNIYIYRLNEDGESILMSKTETDEAGLFHVVAYGFENGDDMVYATSGSNRNQIKDMSQIIPISIVESNGVKTPELTTDLSELDLGSTGLPLSAKENQKLVVTWHSAVLSQTLIADATGKTLHIKPQNALEKGVHTVTWYAVDPETGLRSEPETLQFELTTSGFIRPQFITGEENGLTVKMMGGVIAILSAAVIGLIFKKRNGTVAVKK